jgi:hypothetical protein
LNVRPVVGEFIGRKIGECRDMTRSKYHCHVAGSDGVPFKKSLAHAAGVEGPTSQIGTKGTPKTLLARFPILRPRSLHVMLLRFEACSICPTLKMSRAPLRHDPTEDQERRLHLDVGLLLRHFDGCL